MAIDKKFLQKLLDNPAMFSADDLDLDEPGESLAPDESEEPSLEEGLEDEALSEEEIATPEPQPEEDTEQDDQEIASSTQVPTEIRKKALQKIKQKYLGQ